MSQKKTNALVQPIPSAKPEPASEYFLNMPDSQASHLMMEALSTVATGIDVLPDRVKSTSRGKQNLEIKEKGNARQFIMTNDSSEIVVELGDIDALAGSNKTVKKLFILALIKANEQAIFHGEMAKDTLMFPLQELVDLGFYSNLNSARKGFNAGMDALTQLRVKGKTKGGKNKETAIDAIAVLFTYGKIWRGNCYITLNDKINWKFIISYFTILPKYYFALGNRASDLLYTIFYLARQRTQEINKDGFFTIRFRTLQQRLHLPSETGLNNPKRDIKKPLEDAIDAIQREHNAVHKNEDFQLEAVVDKDAPIEEYLDTGYLKVTLAGTYADRFKRIGTEREQKAIAAQKKHDQIVEAAKIKALAKKIEEADG